MLFRSDAIAARAHASKTTMYRRWSGKAELVADALRHQARGAAPAVPDTGSLRDDLLQVVGQIADTLTGRTGPSLIGLLEAVRDDEVLRELIGSQIRDRSHEVGRTVCRRAVRRGDTIRDGLRLPARQPASYQGISLDLYPPTVTQILNPWKPKK